MQRETAVQLEQVSAPQDDEFEDLEQTRDRSRQGARWRVVFDTGESMDVAALCLVGRNPVRRDGDPDESQLLAVRDPDRSVSKTHLALGVDGAGPWIEDLHSTNGTKVRTSGGVTTRLQPGNRVHISPSDTVLVGGRTLVWMAQ